MTNKNFGRAKYCKNTVFTKLRNLKSMKIFVIDCDAHIIYNFIKPNCNSLLIKTEAVIVKIYKYLHIITVVIIE